MDLERVARAVLAVAFVVGLSIVGLFALKAYFGLSELSGDDVLVIERSPDRGGALHLDVDRTRTEAPRLARQLDVAWERGRGVVSDPGDVEAALAYLDARSREAGGDGFGAPPFDNHVMWDGRTFRFLRLEAGEP